MPKDANELDCMAQAIVLQLDLLGFGLDYAHHGMAGNCYDNVGNVVPYSKCWPHTDQRKPERAMKRMFDILARLASMLYQKKFIIVGASKEYVLPDQLLGEVISYMHTVLSNPQLSRAFSKEQLKTLDCLLQEFERLSCQIPFEDESASNEELVLKNQYWIDVRNLASVFLERSGFDLKEWEKNNCN